MEKNILNAKIRNKTGKEYARKLRKRKVLPAVLYGPHIKKNLLLEIEMNELKTFFSTASGKQKIITLNLVNEKADKQREVIVKDFQEDRLKRELQHIDFYEVTKGEKVITTVALSFVGKAEGEKMGGIVEHLLREIEIECLPKDIPEAIEVDITPLEIKDSLYVKDLKISSGIKVIAHPEEKVISIISPVSEEELEKLEEERKAAAEEVELIGKKEVEEEETPEEETAEEKKEQG
ncbi:MAG: 50S ribosomal protein L25 [Candidatus Aerophobetes bacterium]|nr:50S ribosomal protein L25 [Candidatus Aerophobetes bacterium]